MQKPIVVLAEPQPDIEAADALKHGAAKDAAAQMNIDDRLRRGQRHAGRAKGLYPPQRHL